MASKVCPVVGTTTDVLPPNHPTFDFTNTEARCPVTNAKVANHDKDTIHIHPTDSSIPSGEAGNDALSCPALKNVTSRDPATDATCPIVGSVSAMLPPTHPQLTEKEAGEVCPVTNASLKHHRNSVQVHPPVPKDALSEKCPIVGTVAISP
ncbi:hypothetical protein K431DRAFT_274521 [Polychaeton citri CBS 116435]|uniref:Uncharacterized protein n=1 Tax=Polychaeton citri CBS 116435 TaxID=1314669 RepID=A0A9P4Q0V1_9PEZI|nr:hypothetical protein K431DRAFT_274521 [Polychaeton citri CBS 116435]